MGEPAPQQVFRKRLLSTWVKLKPLITPQAGVPGVMLPTQERPGIVAQPTTERLGAPASQPKEALPGPALAFSKMTQQNQGA